MPYNGGGQRLCSEGVCPISRPPRRAASVRLVQITGGPSSLDTYVPQDNQAAGSSCRMGPNHRTERNLGGRLPFGFRHLLRCPNRYSSSQIGRAHVGTPVTNAQLVSRLLLEKKKT